MLRKLILAAVVWGLLATVPAEARVQTPDANGPSPSGIEPSQKTGNGLVAKKGKKKRKGKKKKGNQQGGAKKKNKKQKRSRR